MKMGFASKYLLIVATAYYLACANVGVKACGSCPPFWTKFQNHCYRFIGEPKSWKDAELHCRNIDACNGDAMAHLTSIHNQEENIFLIQYWQSSLVQGCTSATNTRLSNSVWIGCNDLGTEGQWIWSDNTDVDFTRWHPNEPNGATSESCGDLLYRDAADPSSGNMWNDAPCSALIPFICKMAADLSIEGQWAWSDNMDNTGVDFTQWCPNEPSGVLATPVVIGDFFLRKETLLIPVQGKCTTEMMLLSNHRLPHH